MTELEDPDEYLKGLWAKEHGVTKIIPLTEGGYFDKEFDKKDGSGQKEKKRVFEMKVQCNNPKSTIKIYSPNNTSIKKMIELGKGDTKNLLGKELPIIVSFSNDNWIIYIDPTYHFPVEAAS